MNVLIITPWFPNKNNAFFGSFIRNHAESIQLAGNNVLILALHVQAHQAIYSTEFDVEQTSSGLIIHHLYLQSKFYKWLYINPFFLRKFVFNYWKTNVSSTFQPTILHSCILYPGAVIGEYFRRKLKLRHVISEHWSKVDGYMKKNVFAYLGKVAYQNADSITVVSTFLKERLKPYIGSGEKIVVIPNVIDNKIFFYQPSPVLDQQHDEENNKPLHFIAVATWKRPKLPELLFNGLEGLKKTYPHPFEFHVVGDGPLLAQLNQVNYSYKVNYHGFLTPQQLASLLQRMDFFLHASTVETFSIVVAEALACGLPVLCSNVGALPDLIHQENGLLVENNTTAWKKGLKDLLQQKFNHHQISQSGSFAYSPVKIGKDFMTIYQKTLNS